MGGSAKGPAANARKPTMGRHSIKYRHPERIVSNISTWGVAGKGPCRWTALLQVAEVTWVRRICCIEPLLPRLFLCRSIQSSIGISEWRSTCKAVTVFRLYIWRNYADDRLFAAGSHLRRRNSQRDPGFSANVSDYGCFGGGQLQLLGDRSRRSRFLAHIDINHHRHDRDWN